MAAADNTLNVWKELDTLAKSIRGTFEGIAQIQGQMSSAVGSATGTNGASVAKPTFPTSAAQVAKTIGTGIFDVGATLPAVAAAALGSPQQIAAYQLSTSRTGFLANQSYSTTAAQQLSLSKSGTATSSTDALQAQAALQAGGIYNINTFGKGVAALSNYAPGLGLAGTAAATASLDQAQTVNKLNAIGIQVRGANGLARDPNTIINEFVDKIFATTPQLHGSSTEAYAYIIGSLQSGNQLNMILTTYLSDPNLINLVITKLIAKAKGLPDNATKGQLTAAGITTKTASAISNYNAAQLNLMQSTTSGILQGTDTALSQLTTATNDFAGAAKNLNGLLKAYGYGSTILGGFNGAVALLASSIAGNLIGPLIGLLAGSGSGAGGAGGVLSGALKGLGTGVGVIGGIATTAAGAISGYSSGSKGKGFSLGNLLKTVGGDALSGFLVSGFDPIGALVGAGVGAAAYGGGYAVGAQHGSGQGKGATVGPNSLSGGNPMAVSYVIGTAANLIGTPYVWGGGGVNGPSVGSNQNSQTVGFDCSSFVQYVFAKQGINLPRTTYDQVKCGIEVNPLQAQPGDLLFFGSATAPDHVAIYIGGNQIIQSPHTGGAVEVAGVNLASVSAARRVLGGTSSGMSMSTLFSPSTLSSFGMSALSLGGSTGIQNAMFNGGRPATSTVNAVAAASSVSPSSATGSVVSTGAGITINVTVPASSSPNAVAQTTKTVVNAVQTAVGKSNARTH